VALIKSVAVFCGASMGSNPAYHAAAVALGQGLAQQGQRLVYGGGGIGLMGVVATAVIQSGGEAIGIIPEFLRRREVAHPELVTLEVTDSMHSRKLRMFDLADVFVSIPGGLGTLNLHNKPILICDVEGSAQPLMAAIEATIAMGFARPEVLNLFELVPGVAALLERLATK